MSRHFYKNLIALLSRRVIHHTNYQNKNIEQEEELSVNAPWRKEIVVNVPSAILPLASRPAGAAATGAARPSWWVPSPFGGRHPSPSARAA